MISTEFTSPALNELELYNKRKNNIIQKSTNHMKEGFTQTELDTKKYNTLKQEYTKTLNEYNILLTKIKQKTTEHTNRVDSSNPYLNKVIKFPTGQLYYVTNQGVAKYIPSTAILQSTNIPQSNFVNVSIVWKSDYSVIGNTIPTTPPLVVGSAVKLNQVVGNEGLNVFVNSYISGDTTASYLGCYKPNNTNTNMTFIGDVPPAEVLIPNGNFMIPSIKHNTFRTYTTTSNQVQGWMVNNCALVNNSIQWEFPIPYPKGDQCIAIKNTGYLYTILNLTSGVEYTLSLYACGRKNYDNNAGNSLANEIRVKLHTEEDAFISTINNFTPTIQTWREFSFKFTAPSSRRYRLYFSGLNSSTNERSSAIQNVRITTGAATAGKFTVNDCMNAAVENGYQYFALQNVDKQQSKGYCAVSNDSVAITQHGNATIATSKISLWSSNTSGTGNSAILTNTGSLQVLNSTQQAIYSTPATNAQPSNYIGCYTEQTNNRAMTLPNRDPSYNNTTCKAVAQNGKYSYYGLQNSTTGNNALCTVSNDLSVATKYGVATNCTKTPAGIWSGGGSSNAIYNAASDTSHYHLVLLNNGQMSIHRGLHPDDNQGEIWNSGTINKQKESNPRMTMDASKYGRNWLRSGDTLAVGDYICSPNGKIVLQMGENGNLSLITFVQESNCGTMADSKMGGGYGANAAYNIGVKSIPGNIGKLGFVDENSELYLYPDSVKQYSNQYNVLNGVNTIGNDLPNKSVSNSTVDACKTICNNNADCAGFVFDTQNRTCTPKTKGMYPYGSSISANANTNLYVRNMIPSTLPAGVSEKTVNTNTVQFSRYSNGGSIGASYGLASQNSVDRQKLEQLQSKLDLLSSQMSGYTSQFNKDLTNIDAESRTNGTTITQAVSDIENTNKTINNLKGKEGDIQNIVKDTDIVLLQKNYEYIFWSILAAGSVLVTMHVLRK